MEHRFFEVVVLIVTSPRAVSCGADDKDALGFIDCAEVTVVRRKDDPAGSPIGDSPPSAQHLALPLVAVWGITYRRFMQVGGIH